MLLAFALRVWNIDFGLPYIYHPDEPRYVNVALQIMQTRSIDPHAIPELSINALVYFVNAVAYIAYYAVGKFLGTFSSPLDIRPIELVSMATGRAPFPSLLLYSRIITALFGTAAVYVIFWVGRAFAQSNVAGLLAALLLAVSPGNVLHSKFIVADEMVIFFICLALWASIQIYRRGKISDYLVGGAALGFAISGKVTGAILIVPLGLAHLLRFGWRSLQQRSLYLAAVATLIAFVLSTPFVLVDPVKVYVDWLAERGHYSGTHQGMEGDTFAWYLQYLWNVEGVVVLLGIMGLVVGLFRRAKLTIILTSLLLSYIAVVGTIPVRNDRTILPILPVLCVFAAYGVIELWTLSHAKLGRNSKLVANAALLLITLITVALPLIRTLDKNIDLGAVDGRALAQAWLPDHLPKGAKVAVESYAPFVDPALYDAYGIYQIIWESPEWYIENGFEYLIFSQGMYGRFFREPQRYAVEVAAYQQFFDQFELVKRFEDFGYSISFVDSGYEIRIYKIKRP